MRLYEFTAHLDIPRQVILEEIEVEQSLTEYPYKEGWKLLIDEIDLKTQRVHYYIEGEYE